MARKNNRIRLASMTAEERNAYFAQKQAEYRERYKAKHPRSKIAETEKPRSSACTLCKESKPFTEEYFHKMPKSRWGLTRRCKRCIGLYQIAKKRRITIEKAKEFENKPCAICKKISSRMAVDHCHSTEVIRDRLCHKCNSGLGMFNDDPDMLIAASEYILRHRFFG